MTKFYVCEFVNKIYPMPDPNKVFVKFGITHHQDVMARFDPRVDDGYPKIYDDWDITCKFSVSVPKMTAMHIENEWLTKHFPNPGPNKVWVERYLNVDNPLKYKYNSGISELRLLTIKQAKWVYYTLHTGKCLMDCR